MKILRKLTAKPRSRGSSIVILSMVCMMVMLLTAATLYKVLPAEMHASYRGYADTQGHYVARSGIEETMTWLDHKMSEFQVAHDESKLPDYKSGTSYPSINNFVNSAAARRPYEDKDWRYELEVTPFQDQTTSENNNAPKLFSVRSTSFHRDRPVRIIDVLLKQKTFAMYALLNSDSNRPMGVRLTGTPSIFGPVHTNGYYAFMTSDIDWDDAQYYYRDVVTHTKTWSGAPVQGDGNEWIGGAPYDSNGPIGDRYSRIFRGGRNNLRQKNPVQLPTNTNNLLTEAYAGTLPTERGVHISKNASGKVSGGIYVNGDVARLQMALDDNGNQKMTFTQVASSSGSQVTGYTHSHRRPGCDWYTESSPATVTDYSNCLEWNEIPEGSAGGVAGGAVSPTCKRYGTKPGTTTKTIYTKCDNSLNTESKRTIYEPTESIVYEVTEAPVTVKNESEEDVTAVVGETLVVNTRYDDDAKQWVTDSVERIEGQINGSIYVDGNIGSPSSRSANNTIPYSTGTTTANRRYYEGLTGIVKGSAVWKDGAQAEDSKGERVFVNKTISTPLTKAVTLGGDLLQFSPKRFKEYSGTKNFGQYSGNVANWTKVAIDPEAANEKERYSPNNQHVLGLVSQDVWLVGPRNNENSKLNNGNRKNEVYAVCLAGRTLTKANGEPDLGPDGQPKVSGGFGTYYTLRNSTSSGLGEYILFGGIVQGTSGNNPGTSTNYDHAWIDGSGNYGYNVKLNYDIEATRQQIFPNLSEFRILRYFERSARES